MKKEIEFKCPRCGNKALYYPSTKNAGCLLCGWLLYIEIPISLRKHGKTNLIIASGISKKNKAGE